MQRRDLLSGHVDGLRQRLVERGAPTRSAPRLARRQPSNAAAGTTSTRHLVRRVLGRTIYVPAVARSSDIPFVGSRASLVLYALELTGGRGAHGVDQRLRPSRAHKRGGWQGPLEMARKRGPSSGWRRWAIMRAPNPPAQQHNEPSTTMSCGGIAVVRAQTSTASTAPTALRLHQRGKGRCTAPDGTLAPRLEPSPQYWSNH